MIERVRVPAAVLETSERALRDAGRNGNELFVLWTGSHEAGRFEVQNCHVPPQMSYRSAQGCSVRVDREALHDLNVWLYEHAQALGVQIHSHPSDAYHSKIDDTYPIVTTEGGLSVVVAEFARYGIVASTTATYRLEHRVWQARSVPIEVH